MWFGQLISLLGSNLTTFGLGIWIYYKTGQVSPFAISIFLSIVPCIIFSPFAGNIADKFNKKKIIIISDTLAAMSTVVLIYLIYSHNITIISIYIIIFLNSSFNSFQTPVYQSAILLIVPKKNLSTANGMNQITLALQNLLPPLLGGFLYLIIGLKGMIIIDILTFIFSFIMILLIPTNNFENLKSDNKEKNSFFKNFTESLKFIGKRKGLIALIFLSIFVNFFINFVSVLLTPFILSIKNSAVLGIIQMIGGISMLLGGLFITMLKFKDKLVKKIYIALLLASFGIMIMGFRSSIILISLGYFIFLFSLPFASSSSNLIWQIKGPEEMQGRLFATRQMLVRLAMPLAYLLSGPIVDYAIISIMGKYVYIAKIVNFFLVDTADIRYRLVYILVGISILILTLFFISFKPFRNLETEIPDYSA